MEFKQVKEWKEKELERTIAQFKEFLVEYDKEMQKDKERCDRHNSAHMIARKELGLEDKSNNELTEQERENINILRKEIIKECDREYELFVKFKKENSYFYTSQEKVMYSYYKYKGEEDKALQDIEARFKKDIDKHFDTLQAKVEKKIGKILEISHLGGDDYRFKGELGECKVEVILAGGYNIQRLHTRWIIKK